MGHWEQWVGKHFIVDTNHDHYRTGYVRGQVQEGDEASPAVYVVEYDDREGIKLPLELVSIEEMLSTCEEHGTKKYSFFDDRDKLDAWIKWVESPPAPATEERIKVVSMVDKSKKGVKKPVENEEDYQL